MASEKNQARYEALVNACTGSGHSDPFDDYDTDDDRSIPPIQPVNPIINSTPCPKIDFTSFRKYLRVCPTQRIEIPSEVKNLGSHYSLIDRSLSGIQDTLENLETDELMSQLTAVSNFIVHDFAEISRTLDFI